MAKQSKNTLYNWFKKGLKPLETQFRDWMDSYWHKDEGITISAVTGLQDILNDLATTVGGGSGSGISGNYTTIANLLAGQGAQVTNGLYYVSDASADPTVDAGWALYKKLLTSTGALSDYIKLSEQESLDLIVSLANANETVAGKVEEATDAEMQAGTATGGTGAKLFVSPAKLKTQLESFNAVSIVSVAGGILTLDMDNQFEKFFRLLPAGGADADFTIVFTNVPVVDATKVAYCSLEIIRSTNVNRFVTFPTGSNLLNSDQNLDNGASTLSVGGTDVASGKIRGHLISVLFTKPSTNIKYMVNMQSPRSYVP